MKRSIPRLLLACVCALGLLACAQDTRTPPGPVLPPPNLLQEGSGPALTLLRVIVQFKQPVAAADAALTKTLQDQAQAPVQYLSAIAADTHVYGLQWPAHQSNALALQRLAALPVVARVELDARTKAH